MELTIKHVINTLEELAPLAYAEEFDNVGLLVGNEHTVVKGILVTLDTIEQVVDEAIEQKCNLIVSFHPIIFSGLKKLNGATYVERTIIKAIQNNIAIYAVHTALDNVINGVSWEMGKKLGLVNTQTLLPKKGWINKLSVYVPEANADEVRTALFEAGAGQIGNYSNCSFNLKGFGTFLGNEQSNPVKGIKGEFTQESEVLLSVIFEKNKETSILKRLRAVHPYEEIAYEIVRTENSHQHIGMGILGELKEPMGELDFLNLLKKTFHLKVIRHSELRNKPLQKIALLGGSGSFAISAAKRMGADAYVSADFKYHDFFQAENQILLTDIGHYESEQFTKNLLVDYLTKKLRNFAPALPTNRVILSKINTNPVNFI
ncbi:Nif3-like dinuclear metal center hexameric protein [Flavobacteriaceae bacterium F08102]|nr:Nif3-like dinuclear metal center hexameric protein [Flavobacteriaceae bacterium F08102]